MIVILGLKKELWPVQNNTDDKMEVKPGDQRRTQRIEV